MTDSAKTAPAVEPEAEVTTSLQPEAKVPESAAVLHTNIGHAPAQVPGAEAPPQPTAVVHETDLTVDRVLFADDPDGQENKFLGQSGLAPLPLAGANGKLRKPEEVFAGLAEE